MAGVVRSLTRWRAGEVAATSAKARRIYQSDAFDIRVLPKQKKYARILVVTSHKIGTAVKRNLFRRRIKSIFYEEKLYAKGFDWIVYGKKKGPKCSFRDLKKILLTCSRTVSHES